MGEVKEGSATAMRVQPPKSEEDRNQHQEQRQHTKAVHKEASWRGLMEGAASVALLAVADYLAGVEVSDGLYFFIPFVVAALRQLEAALLD